MHRKKELGRSWSTETHTAVSAVSCSVRRCDVDALRCSSRLGHQGWAVEPCFIAAYLA